MAKNQTRGISLEFVASARQCRRCGEDIHNRAALYAFTDRGTSYAQSSYYHLKCVRRMKPTKRSGEKLHYTFQVGGAWPRNVRVGVKHVQNLLQLTPTNVYKRCLKSKNPVNRIALVRHISVGMAKKLGILADKQRREAHDARIASRKAVPLQASEITKALQATTPVVHYHVYENGDINVRYGLRVRRRTVTVAYRSWNVSSTTGHIHPVVGAPSLTNAALDKLETNLAKTSWHKNLSREIVKKAKSFRRNRALIALCSNYNIDIEMDNDIKTIKAKLLQSVAAVSGRCNINNAADLVALLVHPEPLIRKLAKQRVAGLLKIKRSKLQPAVIVQECIDVPVAAQSH